MTITAPSATMLYNALAIPAFDEAALLFFQRRHMLSQRQNTLQNIAKLDERLQHNLDHLHLFPEATRAISHERFSLEDAADAFVTAYLSFMEADKAWIQTVFAAYLDDEDNGNAIAAALAWMPWDIAGPWIKRFLSSKNLRHKWLAVQVCSLTGRYPKTVIASLIVRDDCRADSHLYASILKLIGQMKDTSLMPYLVQACAEESNELKRAAIWARLLLNDMRIKNDAITMSLEDNDTFHILSPLLIRLLPFEEAKEYMASILQNTDIAFDLKITAIGTYGDPQGIPWLLSKINNAHNGFFIGAAFHQITGFDIAEQGLTTELENEENENQEEDNFFDTDDSLAYPDAEKITQFWHNNQSRFVDGQRYVLGNMLTTNTMAIQQHLVALSQSPINAIYTTARIELALLNPTNTYVPQSPQHNLYHKNI